MLTFVSLACVFATPAALPDKLPLTGLAPAKITPDLCRLHYPAATAVAECQQHIDQGLGYLYSYVFMEAARSFETAASLDPECAFAWYGLSRACEKWDGHLQQHKSALEKAKALLGTADLRSQHLIKARLIEHNLMDPPPPTKLVPSGGPATSPHNEPPPPENEGDRQKRRRSAARQIDELLSLHEDDTEAWFARAQLADGPARAPYYKALLRVDPLHPGAHHELVHYYEAARRPALGYPHAEKYIESSPGLPHAWHMQAHLATRIGRWDQTAERSLRAIELQRAYHAAMNVKAKDDPQYSHHLEILTISLVHDGRLREARQMMAEAKKADLKHDEVWFRLLIADHDQQAALKLAEAMKKRDKQLGAYYLALVYLAQNETARAAAEVDVLSEAQRRRGGKEAGKSAYRHWEAQGLLLCQQGQVDEGLKLLERAATKSKDDFSHHAWGNGAYYMEVWGQAAFAAGRDDVAEEAFLEALAHDPGSVRAALGMEAVCKHMNRAGEASRFADLARRCWRNAELRSFDALCKTFAAPPTLRGGAITAEPRGSAGRSNP